MLSNKITSLLLIGTLSCNFASAEMINVSNKTPSQQNTSNTTDSKINIVEKLLQDVTVAAKADNTGSLGSGGSSMSIAYSYLTPQKDYGYLYLNEFNPSDTSTGSIAVGRDDLGQSWNKSSANITAGYTNGKILQVATQYMTSSTIANKIEQVNASNFDKMYVQTDSTKEEGKNKFIATTLYVRWLYDMQCGIHSGQCPQTVHYRYPVLDRTDGPFIARGDKMDTKPDVYADRGSSVSTIRNDSSRYTKLSDVVGTRGLNYQFINGNDLSCDGSLSTQSGNRTFFEKRYEVRKYIENTGKTSYEAVVPKKTYTTKSYSAVPDSSPDVSIKSKTNYNSNKSDILSYTFNVDINSKSQSNDYKSVNKKTFYKQTDGTLKNESGSIVPNDYVKGEPNENQLDIWQSDITAEFQIVDPYGNIKRIVGRDGSTLSPKTLSSGKHTITINKSDLNGESLHGCSARINVKYKSNTRLMTKKDDYSINYSYGTNSTGSYNDVIKYIENAEKNSSQNKGLKTEIKNHYDNYKPRIEKTFETKTSGHKSVTARTTISAVTQGGDISKPNVTLTVTPPNTLTVLEGADFQIDLESEYDAKNPNLTATGDKEKYPLTSGDEIPAGEVGEHKWVDNFKIDKIDILPENGDPITFNTSQLSKSELNGIFKIKIQGLTANPQNIGNAKVHIKYSYDYNHRTWETSLQDITNPDGTSSQQWFLNAKTITTPQTGTITRDFNIYSLSANTVH